MIFKDGWSEVACVFEASNFSHRKGVELLVGLGYARDRGAVEKPHSNDRPMARKAILGVWTRPNKFDRATLGGEFELFQQPHRVVFEKPGQRSFHIRVQEAVAAP